MTDLLWGLIPPRSVLIGGKRYAQRYYYKHMRFCHSGAILYAFIPIGIFKDPFDRGFSDSGKLTE
jgi:hypothetical protein